MGIPEIIQNQHDRLVVKSEDDESIKYKIISSFHGTYIAKQMEAEETMQFPIFRVFEAAKPEKARKLNIDPSHFFDPYNDSLLDYASIIGYKLKSSYRLFNRQISIHIPLCPNDCWHCYVPKELYVGISSDEKRYDYTNAKEIIEKFLKQRESDKRQGKESNVLRITGGEPFLLPEFMLEVLKEIRSAKLEDEVFLWTETNLMPFIEENGRSFMDGEKNKTILSELSTFKNFAVHPCFHGISDNETKVITGKPYNITLEMQLDAVKKLSDAGIDIYPTFGSNVCNPTYINRFFSKLKAEIHPDLPLKVALVEYNCEYDSVIKERLEDGRSQGDPKIYSRFATLRIWNQLLLDRYGIGYGILPRHLVPLQKSDSIVLSEGIQNDVKHIDEIIYFFKSSERDLYHREILDYLAFPMDHIIELSYEKKHVQDDVFFHMSQYPDHYKSVKVVFLYADNTNKKLLPFRFAEIVQIKHSSDMLLIRLKLGEFISFSNSKLVRHGDTETKILNQYFGRNTLPPDGKYILLGEDMYSFNTDEHAWTNLRSETGEIVIGEDGQIFRNIVTDLIDSKKMNESVFYKISTNNLNQKQKDNRTVYEIKGGKNFSIDFDYYLPNYGYFKEDNPDDRTITIETSSGTITQIGSESVVCSKYGHEKLHFRTKKITSEEEVTLTFRSKNAPFRSAKILLPIFIKPNNQQAAFIFTLGAPFLIVVTFMLTNFSKALTENKGGMEVFSNSVFSIFSTSSGWIFLQNLFIIVLSWVSLYVLYYINLSGYSTKLPFSK